MLRYNWWNLFLESCTLCATSPQNKFKTIPTVYRRPLQHLPLLPPPPPTKPRKSRRSQYSKFLGVFKSLHVLLWKRINNTEKIGSRSIFINIYKDSHQNLQWLDLNTRQCKSVVIFERFQKLVGIFYIFFCLRGRFPSLPRDFLLYFTMILQRIRIIAVDAGFEPGTSAPEVWWATNEPPHLHDTDIRL